MTTLRKLKASLYKVTDIENFKGQVKDNFLSIQLCLIIVQYLIILILNSNQKCGIMINCEEE